MSVVRDVSHHNTIGNYPACRAANDAFSMKITQGTTFVDDAALNVRTGQPARHYLGLAGKPRGPYHFASPVSIPDQIRHFLRTKARIGRWERLDMLDCEFSGVTGGFIRALVAEYRRQSGIQRVQVYLGRLEVTTTCKPATWYDPDTPMWVARYRKIGEPEMDGSDWLAHLGFDHPGLTTYQWDNATPFYPGGAVGDISYERVSVGGPIIVTQRSTQQFLLSNA